MSRAVTPEEWRRLSAKAARTRLEDLLASHIAAHHLVTPEREYRFCTERRWRYDFAWPAQRLLCDVQGGTSNLRRPGRHLRPQGYRDDAEKHTAANLAGWRVVIVTGDDVVGGRAISTLEKALAKC